MAALGTAPGHPQEGSVEALTVVAEAPGDLASFVRAAQAGESWALVTLVRLFGTMVHRIALRVTGNCHDAADVEQQTWLQLMTTVQQVREPERFPGWLSTTAYREAVHLLRQRGRRTPPPSWLALVPEQADSPETVAELRDQRRRVRAALAALPADRSRLLVDLVCEERSYREVSSTHGRPIGSLGPTRARYLRQLEAELARQGAR